MAIDFAVIQAALGLLLLESGNPLSGWLLIAVAGLNMVRAVL